MRFTPRQIAAQSELERRWDRLGFEGLSTSEVRVVALEALEGDVMNGGLGQYFFNSSGDLALVALRGLEALGAVETHRALKEAIAKVWPDKYPTDRDTRTDAINAAEDSDEYLLDDETRLIQDLPEDFLGLALDALADAYEAQI